MGTGTAEKLRSARKKLGLTQEAAAKLMGIPRSSYAYLERQGHSLSKEQVVEIAERLNIPVAEISIDSDNPFFYDPEPKGNEDEIPFLKSQVNHLASTLVRLSNILDNYERQFQEMSLNKTQEYYKIEARKILINSLNDIFFSLAEYKEITKKRAPQYIPDIYQESVISTALSNHGVLFEFTAKVADDKKVLEMIKKFENFQNSFFREARAPFPPYAIDKAKAKKIGKRLGFSTHEIENFVIHGLYPEPPFEFRFIKIPKSSFNQDLY